MATRKNVNNPVSFLFSLLQPIEYQSLPIKLCVDNQNGFGIISSIGLKGTPM